MIIIQTIILDTPAGLIVSATASGKDTATPLEKTVFETMNEHGKEGMRKAIEKYAKSGVMTEGPNAPEKMAEILKNMRP